MTNIEKWQLARNILDAKKAIDSLWFISLHGQELYNVRDLCYGKRSDYYINVCALLDKSICPKKEKKNITNTDSVIKRIYTERDKHYAHKDTSYIPSFPYSSLKAEAFSLQNELRHIRNRCSDYLPDVFTLDYVCYDGQLFRQIEKINPVDEAKIKEQKYPLQNNSGYSENGNDTRTILYDIDDLNGLSEEEKRQFCVVIEDGLTFEEGIQKRQDACVRINVLFDENMWCSISQSVWKEVQELRNNGYYDKFGRITLPSMANERNSANTEQESD